MPAFNLLIIDLKIPIHHQDVPHNLYFQNAKCSLGIYFLAKIRACHENRTYLVRIMLDIEGNIVYK